MRRQLRGTPRCRLAREMLRAAIAVSRRAAQDAIGRDGSARAAGVAARGGSLRPGAPIARHSRSGTSGRQTRKSHLGRHPAGRGRRSPPSCEQQAALSRFGVIPSRALITLASSSKSKRSFSAAASRSAASSSRGPHWSRPSSSPAQARRRVAGRRANRSQVAPPAAVVLEAHETTLEPRPRQAAAPRSTKTRLARGGFQQSFGSPLGT